MAKLWNKGSNIIAKHWILDAKNRRRRRRRRRRSLTRTLKLLLKNKLVFTKKKIFARSCC